MAIKLEFTEQELSNLMAVVDAGVKAAGAQAVRPMAPIFAKIDAAIAAEQQKQEDADDG